MKFNVVQTKVSGPPENYSQRPGKPMPPQILTSNTITFEQKKHYQRDVINCRHDLALILNPLD